MVSPNVLSQFRFLFRNRDFRNLFLGRMISAVGDNLYLVASMWLVFSLTDSTFYTGIAGFLGRVPGTLRFLVGPVVDEVNPKGILVATELAQFLVILIVPVAAYFDSLGVLTVLAVIPILSLSNQFSRPAQNAALPRIVEKERIVKANSAFSFAYRGLQAVGKAVAGMLITIIGAVSLYALDAVTFLAGAVVFSLIHVPSLENDESDDEDGRIAEYFSKLRDGFSLIAQSTVGFLILGVTIANFLNGISLAVLPKYASTFAGAAAYGLLYAGMGVGLFVGSAIVSFVEELPFGAVTVAAFTVSGVGWIAAVLAPTANLTIILFSIAWIPIGIYNVLSSSILQTGVPDDLLGRVMATSGSLSGIASPLGLLVGGIAGQVWTSTGVMVVTGVGFLLVGLYWLVIPPLRNFPSVHGIDAGQFDVR